jgi:hypothetical protein
VLLARLASLVAASGIVVVAGACGCEAATRAARAPPPDPAALAVLRTGFAAATTRLLPFLDRLNVRDELEGRLNDVAAAVETNDACALDRATARAERTLKRLQGTEAATLYHTDLDAIRLGIDEAKRIARPAADSVTAIHSHPRKEKP